MNILDKIQGKLKKIFSGNKNESNAPFVQWIHKNMTKTHCYTCTSNHQRIFENNDDKPKIGADNHPFCECYYADVEQKSVGSISSKGILAPDVYLKAYGKLPDYYITKEEAERKYGWNSSKNTLAGKAPGKMIGGDIYINKERFLPEKEGRVWYECDVDYVNGSRRTCSRLYYSNDGLMFYTDHFKDKVYQIVYNKGEKYEDNYI